MRDTLNLLVELFEGRTKGAVLITDENGNDFSSADLRAVAKAAEGMEKPALDLVTDKGEAVGLTLYGSGRDVKPEPSLLFPSYMAYLLDGDALTGYEQGYHTIDLRSAVEANVVDPGLSYYLPEDLYVRSPGSEREITLGQGRRRDEGQGRWKAVTSTFSQFSDVLQTHKEGPKDGPCFLQGESASGHRKAAAMIANHILGVDLDSGAPLDEVMVTIQKAGLEAIIYTTHSHLKETSVIKRDHFFKWSGEMVVEPDIVADYLVKVKGVLPRIVSGLRIIDDAQHTEEGIVILVEHEPMPKFRAVFPLAEPFIFSKRGGTQQDAILEWKERYAGFCSALGMFFDEKCVDPARLFYLPRHPKGDTNFGSWRIVGQPLDLMKYDRVKMKRGKDGKRRAVASNAFTAAGEDEDDDKDRYITESGFNLRVWAAKHANRFEVQTMLEDAIGGEFIREPRTGGKPGTHVECPFEAEHTNFGGGGTYVINASDNLDDGFDGGFTFHCVHNACSGRDRLDFLKALIDEETISPDDLTDKTYMLALEDDDEEDEDDEQESGLNKRDKAQEILDDSDFGDTEETMLPAFNRRYAVIRTSGGVKILVEPRTPDDDVLFESQNDVSLYERDKVLWVSDGKNKKSQKLEAFKVWLEWEKRRTFMKVVFAPGKEVHKNVYNLFRGWPYSPAKGNWSILREHMFENICEGNEERFDWLMTWLAHIFQHPDQKPGSTVVITGKKGTGKSTLFDYVNQLLSRHGITVSQRKQIVGQFNGHLATTLLMVCEEAFWAADPQAEGVLKDMITNKSMLIEKKGYDPIQSNNYTRLALISNNEWVVPASLKDERRFFVLRCADTRQGDLRFFGAMRRQMEEEGGLEAFMYDLLHWKPINGHFATLYTPPVTEYLQQQQVETLTGVQKFMLELVKSGIYETHDDRVTPIELDMDKPTYVYAVDLRAAVEDYVRLRFASDKAKTSYDDIAAVVKDWFGAKEVKLAVDGSPNKKRTFIFPPLGETRATLKETKGLDIETMTEEAVKAMRTR